MKKVLFGVKSVNDPSFEREYSNLSQAPIGHNEAVNLLSKVKSKLLATDYVDKIETDEGTFMVLTKIPYLGFLKMPHSSVMPFKTSQFVATLRFQINYSTSDPQVLHEWHEMIVALIRMGFFQAMAEGARVGWFSYPDDKRHLQQFVKRFI
jgi:hypothetical protein